MSEYDQTIARIFDGRSRNSWSDKPVPNELIHKLYDIVKLGPTSMNSSPARFYFLESQEAKDRLATHAMEANRSKIQTAPCVVIIAMDEAFYEEMLRLFPIRDGAREMFAGNEDLAKSTAFRNSSLQGAYLIMAARLLGLDCGPMSGFDTAAVNEEFFSDTTIESNFICAVGYANDEPFPRLPRLPFDAAAAIW